MLEHGDSKSISDYILNSARANSAGTRFLVQQWASADDGNERLCSSKQIHREFNSPADKLANEDVRGFLAEMAPVVPDGRFIRLHAPAAAADLSGLIAWTASLSVTSAVHAERAV
jgi:hypothetical protein